MALLGETMRAEAGAVFGDQTSEPLTLNGATKSGMCMTAVGNQG